MLHLALGQLIHEERQREIQRTLEVRRLLERCRRAKVTASRTARLATRHTPAGATP